APSSPADPDLLAEGCRILAGWGLDVQVGAHVPDRHRTLSYLAGEDTDRAADLQQAWLDPIVGAVLCTRGGYGAQRIADRLDWAAMAAAEPKIFSGFSDVTALHEAFALRLGAATLHAPTICGAGFTAHPAVQQALHQALFEPAAPTPLTCDPATWLAPGRATGRTAGGNLSMIATNLATPDGRGTRGFAGCILLLEDVNEDCYRLDRMLTQLLRSGALDGVAGIVLGAWTGCEPTEDVRPVMADRLGGLGVPIACGTGFGHVAPQPVIPLGVPAELDAATGTLTFLEPAVS
ncbi:MAG: S66 peptidase family protein, partial [Streptosporangiaceae bacterium]